MYRIYLKKHWHTYIYVCRQYSKLAGTWFLFCNKSYFYLRYKLKISCLFQVIVDCLNFCVCYQLCRSEFDYFGTDFIQSAIIRFSFTLCKCWYWFVEEVKTKTIQLGETFIVRLSILFPFVYRILSSPTIPTPVKVGRIAPIIKLINISIAIWFHIDTLLVNNNILLVIRSTQLAVTFLLK